MVCFIVLDDNVCGLKGVIGDFIVDVDIVRGWYL